MKKLAYIGIDYHINSLTVLTGILFAFSRSKSGTFDFILNKIERFETVFLFLELLKHIATAQVHSSKFTVSAFMYH